MITLPDQTEHLRSIIHAVLHERDFRPPQTPNTDVRDAYFQEIAATVMTRIKACWIVLPPAIREKGSDEPSDMTVGDAEEILRGSIRFGLGNYRLKAPRVGDAAKLAAYHRGVAAHVMEKVMLSGWSFMLAMRKEPPSRWHSTPG